MVFGKWKVRSYEAYNVHSDEKESATNDPFLLWGLVVPVPNVPNLCKGDDNIRIVGSQLSTVVFLILSVSFDLFCATSSFRFYGEEISSVQGGAATVYSLD